MEKNNYNINLNHKPLSEEEIAKHKDFDALLKAFEATPQTPEPAKVHWMRYVGGAIAAALIGALFFFNLGNKENGNEMTAEAFFASQPYINPPKINVKPNYTNKTFDANQGGIYEYENGSKLIVPPSAFTDKSGNIVQGEVSIQYREFHDFVDFFLSGIPMRYDSLGTKYLLESAGMVEIYAEQNGKRLDIAPDKKIDVQLVSEIMISANDRASIPKFNIYELDTTARNWVYKGVDNIEFLEDESATDFLITEENNINNTFKNEIAEIESKGVKELIAIEATIPKPNTPIPPQRANNNATVFDFDLTAFFDDAAIGVDEQQDVVKSQNEVVDLQRQQYANQLWQLAPNNKPINENAAQIEWDDFKLTKINDTDFELILIKGDTKLELTVNPVLAGSDYDNAMNVFNQNFANYEEQLADREALLKNQKEALAERIRIEKEAANSKYEEKIAIYKKANRADLATNEMVKKKVINRFSISQFGIWNCDRPLPPYMASIKGEFIDNQEKDLNGNQVYLVDKKRNTVHAFYAGKQTNVRFDKYSDNLMWVVTKDNKLAIYHPEDFNHLAKQKKKEHTFVMEVVDKAINSEEDIRKILAF